MYHELVTNEEEIITPISEYLFDLDNGIDVNSIIKLIDFLENEIKINKKERWEEPFDKLIKSRIERDNLLKRYFKEDHDNPPTALNTHRNYEYEFKLLSAYLDKEDLKKQFQEFLADSPECLKTFCLQNIIAQDNFTKQLEFNIRAVEEIYSNTEDFIDLVKQLARSIDDDELKEFSDFLQILKWNNFTDIIYYEFARFSEAKKYIAAKPYPDHIIKTGKLYGVKEFVLIGSNDIILELHARIDVLYFISAMVYQVNDKYSLFIQYHEKDSFETSLKDFLKLNASSYKQKTPKEFFYYKNVIALEKIG